MSEPGKLTNEPPSRNPEEQQERATIWHLPNQLTIARLILSVIFFVVLAFQTHGTLNARARWCIS